LEAGLKLVTMPPGAFVFTLGEPFESLLVLKQIANPAFSANFFNSLPLFFPSDHGRYDFSKRGTVMVIANVTNQKLSGLETHQVLLRQPFASVRML
jgi:hypothetical protein